jgi:hypothetical protein
LPRPLYRNDAYGSGCQPASSSFIKGTTTSGTNTNLQHCSVRVILYRNHRLFDHSQSKVKKEVSGLRVFGVESNLVCVPVAHDPPHLVISVIVQRDPS